MLSEIIAITCDLFFSCIIKTRLPLPSPPAPSFFYPFFFFFFFYPAWLRKNTTAHGFAYHQMLSRIIKCLHNQAGDGFPRNSVNTIVSITSQRSPFKASVFPVSSKFDDWNGSYRCDSPRAIEIIRCLLHRVFDGFPLESRKHYSIRNL